MLVIPTKVGRLASQKDKYFIEFICLDCAGREQVAQIQGSAAVSRTLLCIINIRCTYWSLDISGGPYEPFSGSARSVITTSYSVALGFGMILAAPGKAAYLVAKNRKARLQDPETSSLRSETTGVGTERPPKREDSTFSQTSIGSIPMEKFASDQPTVNRGMTHSTTFDEVVINDLGKKGLGRIGKAMVEGIQTRISQAHNRTNRFVHGNGGRVA
jgi:hypothetical protein